MHPQRQLFIGLISGTSMDGIDAALVDFAQPKQPVLIDSLNLSYSADLQEQLHQLCLPSSNEIEVMGRADRHVASAFANAVNQLLAQNKLHKHDILAIGSHGQTIRHMPENAPAFTCQIGDPNTLAACTGIDVIADFRRKDVALGGQGAPLVPAFHQAVFHDEKQRHHRAVINIGGMANITYLPANAPSTQQTNTIIGFDTGPGNRLLDAWIQRHQQRAYDKEGQWAATGKVNQDLLNQLMQHDYLHQPFPKSTGREVFHLAWLDAQIARVEKQGQHQLQPADVQRTLLEFTVCSIDLHLQQLTATGRAIDEVYICGGGVFNSLLMSRLTALGQTQRNTASHSSGYSVKSTAALGIDPNMVEAMAFAWLAYAFMHKIPGNVPSVTGASRPAILGGWFPAA